MSSSAAPHDLRGEVRPERPDVRKAYRDPDDVVIGGVAAGLARHLAVPVLWVRAGFVAASLLGFLGVALYAGLWLVLPVDTRVEAEAPGLESASRGGRRPRRGGLHGLYGLHGIHDIGPGVALSALGVGLVLTVQAIFGPRTVLWPLLIAVVGVVLLWRQADEAQRERWRDNTGRLGPLRLVLGGGGWRAAARIAAGLTLLVAAVLIVGLDGGSLHQARGVLVGAVLVLLGLAVVAGPWVFRLVSDLSTEREERVRSQERADVAAHLHDSVLQTLALIQKNAADAGTVARLARSQERDLRAWLYAGEAPGESTLAGALRAAAAEVEDAHGISVDVVTVGDADLDDALRPIVAAAREAVTNAAKHAGTGRADVYAEVSATGVDVFVRDRGAGFDPEAAPADRYGVRHSIVDRMRRHGGSAEIRSAPGEGTEVRLHLPRTPQPDQPQPDQPQPQPDQEER